MSVHREPVGPLVREASESARVLVQEGGQEIRISVPDADFDVVCDRARVLQIFANLVGNAVKFTPAGGSITLRAERLADAARFSVEDTGCGIDPGELPHLFDRFRSRAGAPHGAGVGLGLSITRGLVRSHGGTLTIRSEPGEGSAFTFTLPLAPRPRETETSLASTLPSQGVGPRLVNDR
jgi:signal transduction histidine kinase